MENILAIILVFAGVALVTLAIRWSMRRSAEKREEAYRESQRRIEATRVWRESVRSKTIATAHKNSPPRKQETKQYTPSSTTTSTSSSTTDDNFFSGMVTGMLIDNVVNSITHKSEPSAGVSKSESSWGFDDSDSRKSISSSMDTSSSWSSSSSDSYSSSSSDSGPSSDW